MGLREEPGEGYTTSQPFYPQDLIRNSPYFLSCSANDVSSENLVLDQLISNLYFSLFSSFVCLMLYWYCKEKFCLSHTWELKG